jgi:hypothetical protein
VQSGSPGWGKTNRYCYADLEWVCRHTHKMQHTYVLYNYIYFLKYIIYIYTDEIFCRKVTLTIKVTHHL